MLTIVGILTGAIWGGYLARRRKGNRRLDIMQYAVSSGIAFGLLTFFVSLVFLRLAS